MKLVGFGAVKTRWQSKASTPGSNRRNSGRTVVGFMFFLSCAAKALVSPPHRVKICTLIMTVRTKSN